MKLKNIFLTMFTCMILLISLTACESSKSFTFQIDNGEKIKITLNTTNGYDLSQKDGVFTVKKEGEDILNGYFLSEDGYQEKLAAVNTSEGVTILEATPEASPTFYCYQFEGEAGTETDFLFQIEGTKTGVIAGSLNSYEEAETAFQLLEFEKSE